MVWVYYIICLAFGFLLGVVTTIRRVYYAPDHVEEIHRRVEADLFGKGNCETMWDK